MTKLITILILTCATLHAQSVIVYKTDAGYVRGTTATTQVPVSVLTNLSVTGTLTPDVTGTNYVQIANLNGYPQWTNVVLNVAIRYSGPYTPRYTIAPAVSPGGIWWSPVNYVPTGNYTVISDFATGTPAVVYWYQTNYSTVALVTVKGIATP